MSGMRKSPENSRRLEAKRLRSKITKDYVEGTYRTLDDLAVRYGVSGKTISLHLKAIRAIIAEEFREEVVADKERRIKQLEDVQAKAVLAWERSKQNSEELRIQYVKADCKACKGTGMEEDGTTWCEACEGKTKVTEEVISRRVSGQVGDPRFLSLVQDCVREISRLNDHYPRRGKDEKKEEPPGDRHLHLHIGDGKVDPDILIQMRRLMIEAEKSRSGNGEVVDVKAEKPGAG